MGVVAVHSLLIEHDRYPEPNEQLPLWSRWKDIPLTDSQNEELDAYFKERAAVPYEDHDWTATTPITCQAELRRRIGLPEQIPGVLFAMFPNLSFDAKLINREVSGEAGPPLVQRVHYRAAKAGMPARRPKPPD